MFFKFFNYKKKWKLLFVISLLVIVSLLIHYAIWNLDSTFDNDDQYNNIRSSIEHLNFDLSANSFDPENNFFTKLKSQVNELWKIKGSVASELQSMEQKRNQIQTQIEQLTIKINQSRLEMSKILTELNQLKNSIEQAQIAKKELLIENTPDLAPPLILKAFDFPNDNHLPSTKKIFCRMENCFDYSRCSVTSTFPVYVYEPIEFYMLNQSKWKLDNFIKTTVKQAFDYNPHFTNNPKEACLYVVIIGQMTPIDLQNTNHFHMDAKFLRKLRYWSGDGQNHVLINLVRNLKYAVEQKSVDKAIIVQSLFHENNFRPSFDLIISPVLGLPGGDVWYECSSLLPARRYYLISFQGETQTPNYKNSIMNEVIKRFNEMKNNRIDKFHIEFKCDLINVDERTFHPYDWHLCGTESSRKSILIKSTFALIFSPYISSNGLYLTTASFQTRVYEALRASAIPVILGGSPNQLSYSETIDWKKACIFIPTARVTELHFLLRSIPDSDLIFLKRQGRLIWENYLSSMQNTIDTIISVLRERIGISAMPVNNIKLPSVFNSSFEPIKVPVVVSDNEAQEILGPIEPPYASPTFRQNFSSLFVQTYDIWNRYFIPFRIFPQLPFSPLLPSEAKFSGSGYGFRPINKGIGGSGKEFSEALGGNYPREQLTILILTYEREQILMNSLSRLNGLPYLNKVIVVWNSYKAPPEDLKWPEIGVPVHVLKAKSNSLNNRFLPLDIIETEAILSMDDDVNLRHDEIIFAFRVWRENRDRIVGFPGRYHAWDVSLNNSWHYNSNYSCELSMVLTGASFIHRFYLYLYWYWFPQAIRDKVDEFMNCEDIAMNFLVSHLTRKAPIKVTSRWTFRCVGCTSVLFEDEIHFQERHKCINYFSKVCSSFITDSIRKIYS